MTTERSDAFPARTRARLETRTRVYDAAVAEFLRVGVAAAQIEDIVKAAGVARGTFYLHFPTKDHVLSETLLRYEAQIASELRGVVGGSVREFMARTVDLMADVAAGPEASILPEVLGMVARSSEAVAEHEFALVEAVTDFITGAQERGDVRSDAAPGDLASVFLAGLFGVLLSHIGRTDEAVLREALGRSVDVFVRGFSS